MDRFQSLRERFTPSPVKLFIVGESPPQSGKYFYDVEPLYLELLRAFDIPPGPTKREGLKAFQARGLLLLDATYEPVDGMKLRERNAIIRRDFEQLVARLDRTVPVVLIKVNICAVLESLLVDRNFNVLDCGARIPFPGYGNQPRFRRAPKLRPPLPYPSARSDVWTGSNPRRTFNRSTALLCHRQIVFVAWTTSVSFARSSASVSGLPAAVEAEPHAQ
jgi:hypothetical protein